MGTTPEMLAFLQQLQARVADAQHQMKGPDVSDSEDDEPAEGTEHIVQYQSPTSLKVLERSVTYTNGDTYTVRTI